MALLIDQISSPLAECTPTGTRSFHSKFQGSHTS